MNPTKQNGFSLTVIIASMILIGVLGSFAVNLFFD